MELLLKIVKYNIVMFDAGNACASRSINMYNRNIKVSFENHKISKLLKSPHYLGRNYNNKKNSTKFLKNNKICKAIDYLYYYDGTSIVDKIKQTAAKIEGITVDCSYFDCGNASLEEGCIIDLQYSRESCIYCDNIDDDKPCENVENCHPNNLCNSNDNIVIPLSEYTRRPRKFRGSNISTCILHRK